ncbi:hypothetical protein [Pseudodonghicola sp.]|uniref:hypothetical protein n=1 Tax=Pseudodonghicola sp. TaxID=1969463 RepID=UPI003A9697EF
MDVIPKFTNKRDVEFARIDFLALAPGKRLAFLSAQSQSLFKLRSIAACSRITTVPTGTSLRRV